MSRVVPAVMKGTSLPLYLLTKSNLVCCRRQNIIFVVLLTPKMRHVWLLQCGLMNYVGLRLHVIVVFWGAHCVRLGNNTVIHSCCHLSERLGRLHVGPWTIRACHLSPPAWCTVRDGWGGTWDRLYCFTWRHQQQIFMSIIRVLWMKVNLEPFSCPVSRKRVSAWYNAPDLRVIVTWLQVHWNEIQHYTSFFSPCLQSCAEEHSVLQWVNDKVSRLSK